MEECCAPKPTWGPGRSTNGSARRGTDGWQSPRPFSRGTGAPNALTNVVGVKPSNLLQALSPKSDFDALFSKVAGGNSVNLAVDKDNCRRLVIGSDTILSFEAGAIIVN